MNRRELLISGGLTGAAPLLMAARAAGQPVVLLLDPSDSAIASSPVQRAAGALETALRDAGFTVSRTTTSKAVFVIHGLIPPPHGALPPAESFEITGADGQLTVTGGDARGLSYGLRELADRVRRDAAAALDFAQPLIERPVNPVRSVMRQFTSEAYDKAWFYDRDMWPAYLSMLADQRFNRLHLAFGLAYDALPKVRDSYFLFTYPFLVDVPGYTVRVSGLSNAERTRNLDTLRYISEQTVAHGLDFQLGLWMHGYDWPASPGVAMIEGLTPDIHAAYCRDALALLLKELPAVSSVSIRIHGESGVKEGNYGFWKTVFDGVTAAGRTVEMDLHAKGIDQKMIDQALATGMPVNVAPKYWGEHLGMPYHQAAIREYEMPKPGQVGKGMMPLSEGARSFTRYGYADLLRDDRRYTVRHRIFPGTQHLLASSPDPAYGAMFGFCGSTGADIMEPLTFRGRRGTASATPRSGYAATKLEARWDWQKYDAWYRGFGRALYGAPAPALDTPLKSALASASRILPIITTAYMPSAACDAYWPEVYWNQPLAAEPVVNPYGDTLAPKVFDNATPLDPQLFSSMRDHAAELTGEASGRVSPVQVATWLEGLAHDTETSLTQAGRPNSVEDARIGTDIAIQAKLGLFFAAKFRAGVLFALYNQGHDRRALEAAIAQYDKARTAWAAIIALADGVYGDVSSSDMLSESGAWADKLPAIDADIAALKILLPTAISSDNAAMATAIAAALSSPVITPAQVSHQSPATFTPGNGVTLTFGASPETTTVKLWYRHVSQAERWQSVGMTRTGSNWQAAIPADYTLSPYPLQYYAEVRETPQRVTFYPGLSREPQHLPYIVLRRTGVA